MKLNHPMTSVIPGFNRTTLLSATVSAMVVLAGCSDSGSSSSPGNNAQGTGNPDVETRGLTGFANRAEFETTLKSALLNHYRNNGGGREVNLGTAIEPVAAPSPQLSPQAGGTNDSADASSSESSTTSFTETNVQEEGVDEADRVKSDGRYLYVLGNPQPVAEPFPVEPVIGLPVIELDTGMDAPTADIAAVSDIAYYQPTNAKLRILELNPDAADATLLNESTVDLGGQSVGGMYLHGANRDALIMTSTSHGGGYWGYWDYSGFWGTTSSSVHRLNVGDRSNPVVAGSAKFDGQIISSRVVGDHMYLTTRYFPQPVGVNFDDPSVSIDTAVESVDIDAVMPEYVGSDGSSRPLASSDNCFVSSLPENGYYRPDIITIAAINLNDLTLSDSVCYLGAVETLYVSTEAAFLSNTFYDYVWGGPGTVPAEPVQVIDVPDGETVSEEPAERPIAIDPDDVDGLSIAPPQRTPAARTNIHQFDFNNGSLSYNGSGQVKGYVGGSANQQPFRFSHANGYLRVVTENDAGFFPTETGGAPDSSPEGSPVFVSVLKPDGSGKLNQVAQLPNDAQPAHIGKPGEQLYGSRFLGDKAYLVTFRQTDPLYVIDFANPEAPQLAGELEIEGYSDYLHPVGENHLLGLGRGAIPANDGWGDGRGAFVTGIKLSLFDVSNPASPFEVQSLEVGLRGSNAEALFDHHGVTYRPGSDGAPGRLAFGIDVNDIPSNDTFSQVPFYNWRETGLHTFEVRAGDNPGISLVGKMIVEAATPQNPWGPQSYGGDRSILVNNSVFYVHGDQVYGAQWGSVESYNGPR